MVLVILQAIKFFDWVYAASCRNCFYLRYISVESLVYSNLLFHISPFKD
jgi:hypothetical protein